MTTEVTRPEVDQLRADLVRLETRIDTKLDGLSQRMTNIEIALAKAEQRASSATWKFVAGCLSAFLLGLSPYLLHLQGVIR